MPRYLLRIRTDRGDFWCVFSTVTMGCVSPMVKAENKAEAREKLRSHGFMGITDLERLALRKGLLTSKDLREYEFLTRTEHLGPEWAVEEKKAREWDILERYTKAIEELEKELGVKGYNDRFVDVVPGRVEGNQVVYRMKAYEFGPPEELKGR